MWAVRLDGWVGFCSSELAANPRSCVLPVTTLVALGSSGSLCVPHELPQLGVHVLQLTVQTQQKPDAAVRLHRWTLRTLSNMKRDASVGTSALRASDCPQN